MKKTQVFCTTERLQVFLYLLIRDEVPFGVIERIVADLEKAKDKEFVFSEPTQANYAHEISKRILWK